MNLYKEEEGKRSIHLNKFKDLYLTNLHQGIVEENIDSVAEANDDALLDDGLDKNGLGSIEVSIITRFMHVKNSTFLMTDKCLICRTSTERVTEIEKRTLICVMIIYYSF